MLCLKQASAWQGIVRGAGVRHDGSIIRLPRVATFARKRGLQEASDIGWHRSGSIDPGRSCFRRLSSFETFFKCLLLSQVASNLGYPVGTIIRLLLRIREQ